MRAAVLHGPGDLRIEAVPVPRPGPGEVRLRVRAAGICGTDERIVTGARVVSYPLTPGHELVAEVVERGTGVEGPSEGTRVVVVPNWGCGACGLCQGGRWNLCLGRTAVGIDRDGAFAEELAVPARCCWPAPDGLDDESLVLTEPLGVVVRAVGRGQPAAGEMAAVVGAGTLGLLALQVLRARGCRVLVISRSGRRLERARALGADGVVALETGDPLVALRGLGAPDGADLVVETAGTAAAVELCLAQPGLVRPGGRVVLTGLPHEPARVAAFWLVRREIEVRGSMIYRDEFGAALDLLARGLVAARPLVTHRFPLERIHEAFAAHRQPDAVKVAVLPRG